MRDLSTYTHRLKGEFRVQEGYHAFTISVSITDIEPINQKLAKGVSKRKSTVSLAE